MSGNSLSPAAARALCEIEAERGQDAAAVATALYLAERRLALGRAIASCSANPLFYAPTVAGADAAHRPQSVSLGDVGLSGDHVASFVRNLVEGRESETIKQLRRVLTDRYDAAAEELDAVAAAAADAVAPRAVADEAAKLADEDSAEAEKELGG